MGVEGKKRTINLYSPSMAKVVQLVAWEEQRLDLGCIARAFGLDPATIKINGHFIGRGVDFVASSVSWKSLFSFFSARGLSTGCNDSDALKVDGKLSKLGSKRVHDPAGPGNGVLIREQVGGMSCPIKELQLGDTDFVSNKRLKDSNSVPQNTTGRDQISTFKCSRMKRKLLFADAIPLKRERRNPTTICLYERKDDLSKTILTNRYPCSYVNGNMKSVREEDPFTPLPKRIRL